MHLATLVVVVCVAIASSLLSTALIVPKINVATSDGSLQPLNTREIKAASVVFFNNGSYVFNIDASCSAVRGAIQLNNLARQRNLLGRSGLNAKKTTVVEKKESQHVVETRSDRVKRQAAEQDEYERLAHLLDGSPVHQCSCACQNRDSGRKKLRRLLIAFDETEEAGQVIGVNGRVNSNNNAQSSSSSSSSTFVSKQHTNDINREQPLDVAIVNGGGRGQNQGSFSVSETESHKTVSTNENGQQTNGPFNKHLDRLSEEDGRRKEQQETGSFSGSTHEKIETTGQINGQFNNHLDRQRDEEERRKQQTSSFSGAKHEKFDFGTGKHGKLTQNFLDKQREEEERRKQQQSGSKVISSSVSETHKSEVTTSGNGENGASLVNGQNNGGLLVGSFNQNMMNQREEDARRRNQEQSGGSATSSSSSFSQAQHENEQKTINNLNGGSNVGTFEQDRIRQSEEDKKRRQTGQSSTVISNAESHNEQVIKTENGQNGASLISGQNNGGLLVGAFNQNMMNQQEEERKRLQQQGQQGGANQVISSSSSESHKVIKTENGKNVDNINHGGVLVGNFEQDRQHQREEEQRRRNEQQGGSAASSSSSAESHKVETGQQITGENNNIGAFNQNLLNKQREEDERRRNQEQRGESASTSSTFSQTQQANSNNLNGGMYVGTFDADRIRQGEEDEKRKQNGQSSTVISQSESHKEIIKTENGVNGASLTSGQNNGGLLVGAFNQNMMNQQEEERKRLQQQGGANQVISSSSSESHKVIRTEDGKTVDNINHSGVLVGNFEQDRQRQREEEQRRRNEQQGGSAASSSSSSSSSAESHKVETGQQITGENNNIGAFNQNRLNKQREEDERRNQQGGSKVISSTISESHKQVNRSEIGGNSAGLISGQTNGSLLVGAFNQDMMNQQEAERRRQQEQHGGAANQVVSSSTSESSKGIGFEDGDTIIVNRNNTGTTFELDRMRQPTGGSSTLISKTEESHKEQVIKTENSQNGASLVNGQNNGGLQVGAFNQNLMNQQEEERKRQQQSGSTSSSSFSQSQKVVSSENGQNVNGGGVLIGNFEQDRQRQREEEERRKQQGGSTTVVSQSESHKEVTKTENGQSGASLASGQNNGGLLVGAFNQNLMNQQEEERKRQQQSGSASSSSFSQSQKVVSSENGQNVNGGGVLIGNFEQDRQRQREEEERRKQQGASTTVVSQSESHKEVTKTENGQNVNGGGVLIGTFEQDRQRQLEEEENRKKRERVVSKSESKEFHKTESSTQVQENGKINPANVVTPLNALEQQNGQASSSSFSESHSAKVIKTSEKSGENLTADQMRDREELKGSQQQQQQGVSSSSSISKAETHKSETVSGGNIQNGIELTAEQKLARVRELEEQARKEAAKSVASSSSSSSSTSTKEVAFVQTAAVSPQAAQQQGTCSFAQFGNWLETSDAFIQALSPAELVDSLRPGARLQRCDVYFQHGNKRHPGLLNYRLVCHGRSSGDEQLQGQEQSEGKAIVSQQNGPVVLAPLIEANNAGSKIVESKIIERKEEHHVVVNKAKSTRR